MPRDNGENEIMGTVAVIHPIEISIRKSQGEDQARPPDCTKLEPAEPIRRSTAMMSNCKDLNCTSGFSKKNRERIALQFDAANIWSPLDRVATWGFANPL
jgi:hypothetical protein